MPDVCIIPPLRTRAGKGRTHAYVVSLAARQPGAVLRMCGFVWPSAPPAPPWIPGNANRVAIYIENTLGGPGGDGWEFWVSGTPYGASLLIATFPGGGSFGEYIELSSALPFGETVTLTAKKVTEETGAHQFHYAVTVDGEMVCEDVISAPHPLNTEIVLGTFSTDHP